jgi:hypothetical protein
MELDENGTRRFCEHCGASLLIPIPATPPPAISSGETPEALNAQAKDPERKKEAIIQFLNAKSEKNGEKLASTLASIPPRPEETAPKKAAPIQPKPAHVIAEATLDQIGVDAPDDKIEDVKIIVSGISDQFKKRNELRAFMKKVFF